MKHFLFFFCFSFFLSACVYGQQSHMEDSLRNVLRGAKEDTNQVKTLNALAWELKTRDPDAALGFCKNALRTGVRLMWKNGMAASYHTISYIYRLQGRFVEAIENGQKAYVLYLQTGNKKGLSRVLSNNGNIYYGLSDYPKALTAQFKCLRIREELGNKSDVATSYNNIGVVFEKLNDYSKALVYYLRSLKMFEEAGNKGGISAATGNIGLIYLDYKNYPKALEYQLKSMALAKELKDRDSEAQIYASIGNIYFNMSRYSDAMEYIGYAKDIYEEIGNKKGLALCFSNLGVVYSKLKQNEKAVSYMQKAASLGKEIGAIDVERDAAGQLVNVYKLMKLADEALKATEQYYALRDSIINREKTQDILRQEMTFEYQKKESEAAALQEKKDAIAREELKQQRQQRNYFIGGFCMMILLAFFIFNGYRQKQKANVEITQQKKIIEEKSKEVHDSIVYAKRIQSAILPPASFLKDTLPESFILYKPKDIVSGDFYWMEKVGGKILFAVVDCTGHGVPGAMVSVVGNNALNRTVREFKLTQPAAILDKLAQLVEETFEKSESDVKDGMDISLCSFDPATRMLEWAGANNPLWLVKGTRDKGRETGEDQQLTEIKGDKQPIGKFDNRKPFTNHHLELQKGDSAFIFTDGFADQFGGPDGKKFKYSPLKNLVLESRNLAMQEQRERYEIVFDNWRGNLEQVDDICMMGFKI
jgi:serine phosphatase RsbU (regulator of sigma subunit)